MKIAIILCVLCIQWRLSSTEETQNKTKRGLLQQTHYLTSLRPVGVYAEPAPASTQPQGLSQYYTPKLAPKSVYVPEPKVAAQQVVYEYQQTPTNTVSNVHFNQHLIPQAHPEQQVAYTQFVPQPANNNYPQVINQDPFTPSEAVVNPVQHSSIIQHAPYISNPTHIPQTNQNPYLLGKYLYLNGKVMYNANPHLHHPLAKPLPPKQPFQKLTPPGPVSSISFQNYQLPKLVTTTLKPVVVKQEVKKVVPVVEEEEEDEEKADVREEEEEDDDERENYREEEEDEDEEEHPKYRNKDESYGRYSFEDDDDDHESYKEDDDDDDEDSHRGSTKYYVKNQPKRYSTSYKYKEGYKKETKSHKPHKPVKTKESYKNTKNPKKFDSQGKPSQNVPVTVQKVYKEKWYITRNSNPNQ